MQFPTPFLAESTKLTPVQPQEIPVRAMAAGHMMITYDNPVEWGIEEHILRVENAQRTTWAGKKEQGWNGVEYFRVNEGEEEKVRLMALPGSWRAAPNGLVEAYVEEAKVNEELIRNLAFGLVPHPDLSWEKPVSNRDPERIIKAILYRSILTQSRALASNSQLNAGVAELLHLLKEKTLEAKKGPQPSGPMVITLNATAEAPPAPAAEKTPQIPLPPSPEPEEPSVPTPLHPETDPLLLEVAKRVLPSSRLLQARETIPDAAQDAVETARKLIALCQK